MKPNSPVSEFMSHPRVALLFSCLKQIMLISNHFLSDLKAAVGEIIKDEDNNNIAKNVNASGKKIYVSI